MATLKLVSLLSVTIALTIMSENVLAFPPAVIKAGYYLNWAAAYPPSAVDTNLFTHVFYAFLLPNNVTFKFDVSNSTAAQLRNFTSTLRCKKPPAKMLVSFGGASGDPQFYARMASQASSRKVFINSAIKVARRYGFDGLDLDWEFPSSPKEMADLGLLLDEWRSAIMKEARPMGRAPLLLTAAVYFSVDFFLSSTYRKYPVASINKNLDWINVMCYDYHGSWDTSATGAQAALYDPKSNVSTSYGLKSWVGAGVSKPKIVMGLPLYGRTWELKDGNETGIGAPAVAAGPGDGVLTFSQVEQFNSRTGATVVYDVDTVSTYSYAGLSWIGYDDTRSTNTKVGFAKALGLRGYFFWALSYDTESEIPRQASKAW